jgi:Txe/YoeB family toxin of toxin-antitoxin system
VVSWRIVYAAHACRDAKKIAAGGLRSRVEELLQLLAEDPLQSPPPFEWLTGDLAGSFSRRINIEHRLVYQVLENEHVVKVLRMWTHYE